MGRREGPRPFGRPDAGEAGAETRTFTYDGLGRLKSVQPESGTTAYAYDAVGNLLTRTDARRVETSYSYDTLNRVLQKTYTDGRRRCSAILP
jgi:YD repeat-containing protein